MAHETSGGFDWPAEFPEVFQPATGECRAGGFDVVLGNPPFANAIEAGSDATRAVLRNRYPRVRGAADLAYYFLDRAIQLVRPGGRVGLVLPRTTLGAPSAAAVRAAAAEKGLFPNLIYAPERHNLFDGAAVYVCLLALGPGRWCRVSADALPPAANRSTGVVDDENWWRGMRRILDDDSPPRSPASNDGSTVELHSSFHVQASMTAADAYEAAPHVRDARRGPGPRLVTTGLIDPGRCLWGGRPCRFLRRDYAFPRLADGPGLTRSLRARVKAARRPKVLVAGLTRRVECFLDAGGRYVGGVSTFSVYHPADDVAALGRLCEFLLSDDVTRQFVAELGGGGMRGAHLTMTKQFLRSLRLPQGLAGDSAAAPLTAAG